jgi:PAS domain S-box-containing protein
LSRETGIHAKLRTRFVAVAAVSITVVLALEAALVADNARSERAALEYRARLLARTSALMIDREMTNLNALLAALATSPALLSGDLAAFHRQALETPKPESAAIVLYDAELNQQLHTDHPLGAALAHPTSELEKQLRDALQGGHFGVGKLSSGTVQQDYLVGVVLPVRGERIGEGVLLATIPADSLGRVITLQRLPPGWFGGLFDRNSTTLARVPAGDTLVGQPAGAELAAAMRSAPEGTVETITREGVPVLSSFSRSDVSGFSASIGIPLSILDAPRRRSFKLFAAGGGILLLAGIGGTALAGRRLARPAAEHLQMSDERFRSVADSAPVLVWMSGPDKGCVYFNRPWLAFTGRSLEQEFGAGWVEGVHPDDVDRCLAIYASHFDRREPFRMEYRLRRADGEYRWIEDRGVPQLGQDGTFFGYIGSCVDITERRLAEQAIRESEERFRVMAETVPAMLFTARADGRCDYANTRYYVYTGTPPGSVGEIDWLSLVHPDDVEAVSTEWGACTLLGKPYAGEFRVRSSEGSYRWFATRADPVRDADGNVLRWLGSAIDVNDLKQAGMLLEQLAGRLLTSQEDERRRIARELHDSTAQILVAASLNSARLQKAVASSGAKAVAVATELGVLIDQALLEIRTLSYLFHPPLLEERGLESTLQSYAAGFAKRSGIAVEVAAVEEGDRLPPQLESALFRVAQESLANIHRHSGAARAYIRLWRQGSTVALEIEDDGKGFKRAAASFGEPQTLGVGIVGMRIRLRQLGGDLRIKSGPGGTTVTAMAAIDPAASPPVALASRRRG